MITRRFILAINAWATAVALDIKAVMTRQDRHETTLSTLQETLSSVAIGDLYTPKKQGYYSQELNSANRPTGYGVAVSFSSMGHFNKVHNNWISTIAFGTDGRLFFSQSINGAANNPWREIYHSGIIGSRNVAMSAVRAGNAVGTAQPFFKKWAKITDTTPPKGSGKSIPHGFNRQKIINVSYRIDGAGFSACEGLYIEIHDSHFAIETVHPNAQLGNKPVTIYVEYEP